MQQIEKENVTLVAQMRDGVELTNHEVGGRLSYDDEKETVTFIQNERTERKRSKSVSVYAGELVKGTLLSDGRRHLFVKLDASENLKSYELQTQLKREFGRALEEFAK